MAEQARRAGQIIQRGKRAYYVRVFLGRDEKGKRKFHNKTIHGTKKDAQKYLNAALRELDLGTFVEPAGETLNTFLDHWLKRAGTIAAHRSLHARDSFISLETSRALGKVGAQSC